MKRAILLIASLTLFGCGPERPEMGRVKGLVHLDGKPLAAGTIQFWPSSGRPSRGSIKDGEYQLTTFDANDGALVGHHVVTIKSTTLVEPEVEIESTQAEIDHYRNQDARLIRASEVRWIVPREYADRSASSLTAVVQSGLNDIDFDLSSEPNGETSK